MEKRWRCTICGYVHQGEAAADICPVCGVGAEKFELMAEKEEAAPEQPKGLLREMFDSFMPHAVAAHFPNALIPTLALFLLLYLLLGLRSLDAGIYLLLGLIALSVPVTLLTGIYSWRRHYDGARSSIFHRKLTLGVVLVLICGEMLLLRYRQPDLLHAFDGWSWLFLGLGAAALGCVGLLGHYGGLLVFGRIERNRAHFD